MLPRTRNETVYSTPTQIANPVGCMACGSAGIVQSAGAAQLELFNHETISEGKNKTGLGRYPPLVTLGAYGHEWEINILNRVGDEVVGDS